MSAVSDSLGSLAKSAGLMMVGSIVGRSLGLIAETLIVRQLEPAVYGEIALAYTIITMVGNVFLLGVQEGVTRFGSAEASPGDQTAIVQAGIITAAASGTTGIVLVTLLSEPLSIVLSQPSLSYYLLLLLPYLVVFPLSRIAVAVLRSQERAGAVVIARTGGRILAVLLLLGVLFAGLQTTAAAIYWVAVPLAIVVIGGGLAVRALEGSPIGRPSWNTLTRLWRFSLPLAMSSIIFILLSRFDILMIGYFLQAADVGNYRAIQPLQQAATFVTAAFSFLFLPLATKYYERRQLTDLDQFFTVTTKWSCLMAFPIVLVFSVTSEELVFLLFGRAYEASALPLAILSAGLFLRSLAGPNGDVVKAMDQTRIEFQSAAMGLVANAVLNILLIPVYGISGAAIATVCGYAVYNLVELYAIYSEIGVSPFSFNIVKPLVMTAIIVVVVHELVPLDSAFLSLTLVGTVSGITTAVSLIVTRSVEDEDIVLMRKIEDRAGVDFSPVFRFLSFGKT